MYLVHIGHNIRCKAGDLCTLEISHVEFKNKLKLDNWYSILHYETITRVRNLKINKRPRKQDTRKLEKRIVNTKNLVRLRNNPNLSNNIRIGTVNTRSIRNKTQLVLENSRLENLDFLVITETWLTDTDEDQQWLKTSELDNSDYRIEVQNRTNKKGGGLALLYRKHYNPTRQLVNTRYNLLEHASWAVELKGKAITILAIYHPPLGPAGNTITRFINQVGELFQYYLANHKNLVILGNFNIHVHDGTNPDSLVYINTLAALGLTQHISTPTHRLGGTLDLIYTESLATTRVIYSFTGNYISDHRLVGIELETSKLWEKPTSTRFRKYTDLTLENFTAMFRNEEITQHSKLEDALEAYNKELERTLDKLVPAKKKADYRKQSRPWYNASLLDQRKIVRNRERIFNHYRLDHQWKAFTRERNRYNTMLNYYKRNHLVGQVKEAQNDSKQLFRIVDSILGRKNENPLPKANSSIELAEDCIILPHKNRHY